MSMDVVIERDHRLARCAQVLRSPDASDTEILEACSHIARYSRDVLERRIANELQSVLSRAA